MIFTLLVTFSVIVDLGGSEYNSSDESFTCKFPSHSTTYTHFKTNAEHAKPGDTVPGYLNINVTCEEGFGLVGPSELNCFKGHWWPTEQIPQCISLCYLPPHPSVEYHCLASGNSKASRICSQYELSGTTVMPKCREPIYHTLTPLNHMHCNDGRWDYIARCIPDCGTVHQASLGEILPSNWQVPWFVHIYNKVYKPYKQICGGSIISNTLVISAAHCFTDAYSGVIKPVDYFAVGVGKLYRAWDDVRDDSQKSDVKEIHSPGSFRGSQGNSQDDICVVIVATPFKYRLHIRPICVDFDNAIADTQLMAGKKGKIAGTGLTVKGTPAPVLGTIDLPFVSLNTCIADSPLNFRGYITSDKFCAGFLNAGKALCAGDSGGGLAFLEADVTGSERYFLRGIASAAPYDEEGKNCNPNVYTAFTSIQKHEYLIKRYLDAENLALSKSTGQDSAVNCRSLKDRCIYPVLPNDKTYYDSDIQNPTNEVSYEYINVNVSCDDGFGLDGPAEFNCRCGRWTPSRKISKCVPQCHLPSEPSVEYYCLSTDVASGAVGTRVCKEYEPEGTEVVPKCRRPVYYAPNELKHMWCQNGKWSRMPKCIPDCGTSPDINRNGTSADYMPWHAVIYNKEFSPPKQICGGFLISTNIVLSAAHCFWNSVDGQQPAAMYAVAVGKWHRTWNENNDIAQQSDVKEIHLPDNYQGGIAFYQDDIAIIIVTSSFDYAPHIRPVCLDFDDVFHDSQLKPKNVGKMARFGLNADGSRSQTIRVTDLQLISIETCAAGTPLAFLKFITSDKFCASLTIGSTAICQGDTGGGLVISGCQRGRERYFLRGIASVSHINENISRCNLGTYITFTSIQSHKYFIRKYWKDESIDDEIY